MEEINLIELLKYYIRKIPIIILSTLLSILIGYLYIEHIQIPMYQGTTTIILVQKNDNISNNNITQGEIEVNEKLVSTYSEIIKSRRVLEQVIDSLKLDINVKSLSDNITVTSVKDTSIIKIIVNDINSKNAMLIANKTAEIFKKEITKIYNLENISTIDEAIEEQNPYNVNFIKQMIIYSMIGFLASFIIIFVTFYFNTTIKNKKEIEEKIKLPVLGEIPTASKLIKKEKNKKEKQTSLPKKEIKKLETKKEISSTPKKKENIKKTVKRKAVASNQKNTSKKKKGKE